MGVSTQFFIGRFGKNLDYLPQYGPMSYRGDTAYVFTM